MKRGKKSEYQFTKREVRRVEALVIGTRDDPTSETYWTKDKLSHFPGHTSASLKELCIWLYRPKKADYHDDLHRVLEKLSIHLAEMRDLEQSLSRMHDELKEWDAFEPEKIRLIYMRYIKGDLDAKQELLDLKPLAEKLDPKRRVETTRRFAYTQVRLQETASKCKELAEEKIALEAKLLKCQG